MTDADYAPSSSWARGLDEIADWIQQHPDRVGVYAFIAARLMERDQLCYRTTFDRIVRAACSAGLTEAAARLRTFHGFASAAAGYLEPPPQLADGGL